MDILVLLLLFSPWVFGAVAALFSYSGLKSVALTAVAVLAVTSIMLFFNHSSTMLIDIPLGWLFIIADFILLGYFIQQGLKYKSKKVTYLAILQVLLFGWVLLVMPHESTPAILVDKLSVMMMLLINIVGGLIVLYALAYIDDEEGLKKQQKSNFIAILILFLGVMNLAVCLDNIEWFFLAFELTTLASYLLIRYRMDALSINNALRALWMNQIGGVAILIFLLGASYIYGTVHFSTLMQIDFSVYTLYPIAFLAIAALIKGAQMPFDKWLLGAMVAPTPVSAILHSATMVKIAPYIIIKLSPIIAGTPLGTSIMILSGAVFVLGGIYALSKENFKEILAYSTISLLGLMIMLAAQGSGLALSAALMLIIFHGLSKALLFLQAGVYEKHLHAKTLPDLSRAVEKLPVSTILVLFGFISITLPPFGAFLGKWLAMESLASMSYHSLSTMLSLLFTVVGSVVITLLYFRVTGSILMKDASIFRFKPEQIGFFYRFPSMLLAFIIFICSILIGIMYSAVFTPIAMQICDQSISVTSLFGIELGFGSFGFLYICIAALFMLAPLFFYFLHLKNIDRVKEFNGGERMELNIAGYYFDIRRYMQNKVEIAAVMMFILIIVSGGF